jgi:hypothetical protein
MEAGMEWVRRLCWCRGGMVQVLGEVSSLLETHDVRELDLLHTDGDAVRHSC